MQDTSGPDPSSPDEAARVAHAERIVRVTAAITAAVSDQEVLESVVDSARAALGAATAVLFRVSEDRATLELARSVGYAPEVARAISSMPLDVPGRWPAVDCVTSRAPIFLRTREALVAAYPHLADVAPADRAGAIACLPLVARGEAQGVLVFGFGAVVDDSADDRAFLVLVAQHACYAVERLRLVERERAMRERAELLHALAAATIRADSVERVFEAARAILERALGTTRSAILAFDDKGTMAFQAWSGVSEAYRRAVDGHSPWQPDTPHPTPIVVADVEADGAMAPYRAAFQAEGVRALAFVPLVSGATVIGKLMVYYDAPRRLSPAEIALAEQIADHLSAAIQRFRAIAELERTIRFHDIFAGMLGHDLRNPLAGVLAAAQLAEMRAKGNEAVTKPLSRVLSSGWQMSRMIDQLLDVTRIRLGEGISITCKPMDVVATLRKVLPQCGAERARLVVRAVADEDESSGSVVGVWDEDRLGQLFASLVSSAVRREGGDSGQVTVLVDDTAAEGVRVTVHDPGVIPREILPSLFDPMAPAQPKGERRGLGAGLYIGKEIVAAHRGVLSVTSEEGDGTTFAVLLPRESENR